MTGHSKTYPNGLLRWSGLTKAAKPATAKKDYSAGMSPMTVEKLAEALYESGWHDVTITRAGDGTTATLATIGPRDRHGRREIRYL